MSQYNQFKAMLAITRASLRSITRSPSAVVFTLLFPLIFILVFGFIGGREISIKVGVLSSADRENQMFEDVKSLPGVELVEGEDSKLLELAAKGRIDAIVNIKVNADTVGPAYILEVKPSTASPEKGKLFLSLTENLTYRINMGEIPQNQTKAELRQGEVSGRKFSMIDFILPGQLGFSILSTGVFGTAFVFFNLRQTLVIKRFFATPIKKPFIILGEALSRMVFSLTGALFIILVGYWFFGFTLIHGAMTALYMMLLSALGLIVFMGFGFVISGLARNESMIPPLANLITLPQFLLSGTFFPIDSFPTWLQPICKFLPLTYLNEALRLIAFEGAGIQDIWWNLLVILGWGIVVYSLAVRFFRWE